nr:uncharacterized protein LOC107442321 [Parasteatoda tepidariorum]
MADDNNLTIIPNNDGLDGSALQGICETRWVEKHDGHLQFQGDSLSKICKALNTISTWQDAKTASDAQSLLYTLQNSDFIISTFCLCDVLGTTVPLSRLLQTPSLDLKRATTALTDTITILEDKRKRADDVFQQLFSEIRDVAEQLNVELRPKHLKDRLSPDVMKLFNLRVFLPHQTVTEEDLTAVREPAEFYKNFLNASVKVLETEFRLWVAKWQRETEAGLEVPNDLSKIINACDIDLYPLINMLLRILITLPVSAATAERSFSTLRSLKTWFRTNQNQERLNGLALLNIHRETDLDVEKNH